MDYCENCSRNCRVMDLPDSQRNSHNRKHETLRHRNQKWPRVNAVLLSSLLLVLLATLIPLSLASSTCTKHEYWDMETNECTLCTKCNQQEVVLRPCQRHKDAICQPLNAIEIDWSKSMASETTQNNNLKLGAERLSAHENASSTSELNWDWQMITLVLAIIACLMFFIGTAITALNYIRQWRKIKKHFDNDIEGLSQQLMARLAMPTLEGSTIFIDDPSAKRGTLGKRQIEVRCVYLEDILDGKKSIKDCNFSPKGPPGNVYIRDHEKQQHPSTIGQRHF